VAYGRPHPAAACVRASIAGFGRVGRKSDEGSGDRCGVAVGADMPASLMDLALPRPNRAPAHREINDLAVCYAG